MRKDDGGAGQVQELVASTWDWGEHVPELLDIIPDVLYALAPDGSVLALSPPFEAIIGWTEAEWLGRPFAELIHPRDLPVAQEHFRLGLQGEKTGPYRLRVRTKSGGYVAGEFRSAPLVVQGEVVGKIGVARDITPVTRVEVTSRFLEEATQILASSLDYQTTLANVARLAVPDVADWCAVDVVDDEGRPHRLAVAHVDPAKEALAREIGERYGEREEGGLVRAVSESGKSLLFPEITDEQIASTARDAAHLETIRALGLHSAMLVPLVARDRCLGVITFILAESDYQYDGEDLALAEALASRAAVAVDNARLYHEAQEALQRRDEFLSIASHELRTPLTSIGLQISMLNRFIQRLALEPEAGTRLQRSMQALDRQVKRLNLLVDQLLDVSRLAAGRLALERDEFDLVEMAREVTNRFRESSGEQGPLLLQAQGPVIGRWDRFRLDQILTNLIANAFKYAPGSPLEISVARRRDWAEMTVRDFGPGIPAEQRSSIFERFARGDHHTESGLGLGLYICRQLAMAHGGTIELEPVAGEGAAFTVRLPLAEGPAPEA